MADALSLSAFDPTAGVLLALPALKLFCPAWCLPGLLASSEEYGLNIVLCACGDLFAVKGWYDILKGAPTSADDAAAGAVTAAATGAAAGTAADVVPRDDVSAMEQSI